MFDVCLSFFRPGRALQLGVASVAWLATIAGALAADDPSSRTRAVGAPPQPALSSTWTCPADTLLYAFDVLHGAWIDHAGPLCVGLDEAGNWVPSSVRTSVARVSFERDGDPRGVAAGLGGTGGEFQSELACPQDTLVVGFEAVVVADRNFVGRLNLLCRGRTDQEETRVAMGPPDPNHPTISYSAIRCPQGFVANGLYGDGSQYVARIGLTCIDDPRSHRVTQGDFGMRREQQSRIELDAQRSSRLRGVGTERRASAILTPPAAPAPPPPPGAPKSQKPEPPPADAAATERSTARFSPPLAQGRARLSACLDAAGTRCGAVAADAFCRQAGYAKAIGEQEQAAPAGATVKTLAGAACGTKACRTFSWIECADR